MNLTGGPFRTGGSVPKTMLVLRLQVDGGLGLNKVNVWEHTNL